MKDYRKQTVIEMKKDDVIRFYDSKGNKVKTIGCGENNKGCKYTIFPNEYVMCISDRTVIGLIIGQDCETLKFPINAYYIEPGAIHIIDAKEYVIDNPSINRKGKMKDIYVVGKYTKNTINTILFPLCMCSESIAYAFDYIRPNSLINDGIPFGNETIIKKDGIVFNVIDESLEDCFGESESLVKYDINNTCDGCCEVYVSTADTISALAFTHIENLTKIIIPPVCRGRDNDTIKHDLKKMYPEVEIVYHNSNKKDNGGKKKGNKKKK